MMFYSQAGEALSECEKVVRAVEMNLYLVGCVYYKCRFLIRGIESGKEE